MNRTITVSYKNRGVHIIANKNQTIAHILKNLLGINVWESETFLFVKSMKNQEICSVYATLLSAGISDGDILMVLESA